MKTKFILGRALVASAFTVACAAASAGNIYATNYTGAARCFTFLSGTGAGVPFKGVGNKVMNNGATSLGWTQSGNIVGTFTWRKYSGTSCSGSYTTGSSYQSSDTGSANVNMR